MRPAKTQLSLGIRPVWSESSLSAWRNLGPLATHWEQREDSDQTGWMPRLIWVFAGPTLILLVLSCRGSYIFIFGLHILYKHPCQSSTSWRVIVVLTCYQLTIQIMLHPFRLLTNSPSLPTPPVVPPPPQPTQTWWVIEWFTFSNWHFTKLFWFWL